MSFTFGQPIMPLAEAARQASIRGGPAGPKSLDSRWIKEDFPFGIAPVIALADVANVPVPLHRAGCEIFGSLLGRDLTANNDLLPHIKLEDHSPETLTRLVS